MNQKLNTSVKILIGESLSIDDLNVLSLLYMPIIGNRAYTLYMTFYSALNRSSNTRVVKLGDITDLFGITINVLTTERKKLEAIGLLNTYYKENEYVYLLKAPLSARSFFKDGVLAIYLKNRVGEALFDRLVSIFKLESFNKEGYENVTDLFDNVFKDKVDGEIDNIDGYFPDKNINSSIKIGDYKFDYDLFISNLNLTIDQKRSLNAELQTNIEKTAYAYNLNEEDMQVVYHRSFDQLGNFSIAKFQREAKLIKKLKDQDVIQPKQLSGIEKLKVMDPKEVLKILNPKALARDYDVIDKVSAYSPFDLGITNVIILHVLNKNNKVCPDYGYFLKTFNTFSNRKITTFDEAVAFITAQATYDKKTEVKDVIETKEEKKIVKESTGSNWLDNLKKELK